LTVISPKWFDALPHFKSIGRATPMMKQTVISASLRSIFSVGLGLLATGVMAQDTTAIQRVEITGSSIKRINQEGALPVQSLSRADIEQTGVTNVADLVALLPAMQGFITSSASVNGGGGGVQTASVHAIGTAYTLVLLNGRRMAPYGTGSAVNLASIPLSAVERVEILTDGASTLYGSDAIAGVINFILKKNHQDLTIDGTFTSPEKSGGRSSNFSISKGFGDLDKDGYNLMLAYSHDEQKSLNANQREFSKSGIRRFEQDGKQYAISQTSGNSNPANVEVVTANADKLFSADYLANGKCTAANTFVNGNACRYDYAATVQLMPELKRDSVFANGTLRLNPDTTLFSELVMSKFTNTARYAAAAQPLTVFSTDPETGVKSVNAAYLGAYNKSVVPLLSKVGINPADATDAFLYYRGADAGGRTDEYRTDAVHFVAGADSRVAGWDVNAAYTHSQNKQIDTAVAGYLSGNAFEELVRSGAYNPFVVNPNGASVLAPAVLHQVLGTTHSKIDVANVRGSREVFALPGGPASLGLGADFTRQSYQDDPSAISKGPGPGNPGWTDVTIGGGTGSQALDASRKSWGSFAELLMPVMKNLELTGALRYDSYDAVEKHNTSYDINGVPSKPGTVGEDVAKATYKLSARYTPVQSVMLRGSYGTGFKAPTMNDVADPLKNGGSSEFFACPITKAGDPRLIYCKAGESEYGLLTSGNPTKGNGSLQAERSKQSSLGLRWDATNALSVGVDLWDVKLRNQIRTLSQEQIFTNPVLADKYISVYYDPIQKSKVLVATLSPVNLASSHYRGIDFDSTYKTGTPIGKLAVNWSGTYMLKAEQDVPGSGIEKSIGRFDSYNDVVFRLISRVNFSLKSSEKLSNTLTVNYRSGYHDAAGPVVAVNADGTLGDAVKMKRDVSDYTTVDYQAKLNFIKNLTLTLGVRNLLAEEPPLSIRNSGGGNQVGYDGRYTDPLGRTFYVTAAYKF
jgi:iron complex outermembrane receptor protein